MTQQSIKSAYMCDIFVWSYIVQGIAIEIYMETVHALVVSEFVLMCSRHPVMGSIVQMILK